jgi:hypothetical protein
MKRLVLPILFAFVTTLISPAFTAPAQAQQRAPAGITIPVTGAGDGLAFAGNLNVRRFVATDSGLAAIGILTGTLTDTAGVVTSIARTVTIPVTALQATCDILHLELGPLNLDLLGLVVNLNRVVLDIAAEAGAGNLLGNLLCAVVGLLDSPGGLARLLNQLLGILG